MVTLLLAALGAVLIAAFVLAPLFRPDEDLKPIRRQRPGTRHLHGLDSVDVEFPDTDQRCCPHCGSSVGQEYNFCGQCCKPLP
jgi:hypothetical protein